MASVPLTKRRLPKGDAADEMSDVSRWPKGHSDTESDISCIEGEKRLKLCLPRTRQQIAAASVDKPMIVEKCSKVCVEPAAIEVDVDTSVVVDKVGLVTEVTKPTKKNRRSRKLDAKPNYGLNVVAGGVDPVAELKRISSALMEVVLADNVDRAVARLVSGISADYEVLMMRIISENERLRGRLEASGASNSPAVNSLAAPVPAPVLQPAVVPAVLKTVPVLRKPVETWSVVVKGKGKEVTSSKEVIEKVVSQVGPTLGVRVHDVRPLREGGAVIRTPSRVEREKMAANKKFAEVGLEVAVKDKLGPKVTVQKVHTEITPDDFMGELFELNLKEKMSPAVFKRSVRLVSAPWEHKSGEKVNVVLECTSQVADHLCGTGAYIKWFRFAVRAQEVVRSCYRCLGFDHKIQSCRMREETCFRCGTVGHRAAKCQNAIKCRNCQFKGWPADHRMMTAECPIYGARVARVVSRH